MSGWFTSFLNCRLCRDGNIVEGDQLVVSDDTGDILHRTGYIGGDAVDLEDGIIAPGFLEIQTNGLRGFHFTHFQDKSSYASKIDEVAKFLPTTGVTGFYPTIPTIASNEFQQILPSLAPRSISDSASLLGAHAEGPYLAESKKGAHNASLFQSPTTSPVNVYGDAGASNKVLKLVTVAPELNGSEALIRDLTSRGIRISLGHSNASYNQGVAALQAGATGLTHTLNAMAPLHHRDPGLAGLVTAAPSSRINNPYFSLVADGNHLHPSVATMLFRSNPSKCILTTDSIELAGLPDGTYPGHSQIPHNQTKKTSSDGYGRVVIEGTDTLIGGCATLDQCVRNLMQWSGCNVAEAVKCVTENVADFMGEQNRGKLEAGRKADFVVLDDDANVLQTWVAGLKVWDKEESGGD